MVVLMIIAALLVFAYFVHVFRFMALVPMLVLLGVFAVAMVIPHVGKAIRAAIAKKPKLTAKQQAQLDAARVRDEQKKEQNAAALAAAQERHDKELRTRQNILDREIDTLSGELRANLEALQIEFAKLAAMDCLGPDEKDLQVVDLLIHFIRTRRADDIKEALHEYDKLVANQQLLELENQKLELERQKAIQEHNDRVEQMKMQEAHNREMEWRAFTAAEENKRIAKQIDYIGYLVHTDVTYNR